MQLMDNRTENIDYHAQFNQNQTLQINHDHQIVT